MSEYCQKFNLRKPMERLPGLPTDALRVFAKLNLIGRILHQSIRLRQLILKLESIYASQIFFCRSDTYTYTQKYLLIKI